MIFYRSLASESSVTGLGVHTRWWMYGNITLHSLCYLARVRPVHRTMVAAATIVNMAAVDGSVSAFQYFRWCALTKPAVSHFLRRIYSLSKEEAF